MIDKLKTLISTHNNVHRPNGRPNVLLFSTPRSGSTWLMELILTQPGFKPCDEPFDLRQSHVARYLNGRGVKTWSDLYDETHAPALESYLMGVVDGRLHLTDRLVHRNRFRLLTHRVVFKLLHAGEDRIARWRDVCRGRVVFLVRHPLPVSLSRKHLPRLSTFLLEDGYGQHLEPAQLRAARRHADSTNPLERGVLDWCLQNAVPLAQRKDDWLVVTYEQLVLDPEPVIRRLCERLDLDQSARMQRRLRVASASTRQSDPSVKGRLADRRGGGPDNRWLLEKWRSRIDAEQERRLMAILADFDIDLYQSGDALPNPRVWLS